MNQSPFKISGQPRRALKKELSELKRLINYNPQYLDLCHVYGTPAVDNDKTITKWEDRIKVIERKLLEIVKS